MRLHSVTLIDGASAIGKRLGELALNEVGAEVTAIRRGKTRTEATLATVLETGDVVVLRGSAEAVSRAESRLLK